MDVTKMLGYFYEIVAGVDPFERIAMRVYLEAMEAEDVNPKKML